MSEKVMSRKVDTVLKSPQGNLVVESSAPAMDGTGVGMHVDPTTGKHTVVHLKFNLASKKAEVVEVLAESNISEEAYTQLKVKTVQLGLLGD